MRLSNAAWLPAIAVLASSACGDPFARTADGDGDGDGDGGKVDVDVPPQVGICGDGLVDADQEACDDANDREGDGCNSDCRASGERVWCLDDFGPADVDDGDALPTALAVGPSGDVAVLGTIYDGGSVAAWLQVVDATGAPRWSTRFEGATGTEVGFSSDGTLAVAIYEPDDARSRITLFSTEGTAGANWTDETGQPAWISAFAMSPHDRIIAVGGEPDVDRDEVWIGTFSPGLRLEQQTTYRSSQGISTRARAVVSARAGTVILGADVILGPGTDSTSPPTTVAIAALLPSGALAWDHVFESTHLLINLASVAALADDTIVATGATGGDLSPRIWTASLSAVGGVNWEYTGEYDGLPSLGTSVAPASIPDFLFTSTVSRERSFVFTAVFGRYDHERRVLWEREYSILGESTGARLSARGSSDRSFLIAGSLNPSGVEQHSRSWLCKYTE